MAVSITSNLTLVDAADATTGWTSDGGGATTYSGFQREGSAALGEQASNGTLHLYHTITSVDLSSSTILGPWLRSGNPTAKSTGGFRIVVGDGTNRAAFYVGGSDDYGFFYGGYSLYKLDLAQDNVGDTALAGSATITATAVTEIGGGWNYGSKATGNSDNVFLDVVRYVTNGTPALVIGGGGSGTEGNWAEVVTQDESSTNAWGIIRLAVTGSKVYDLNFGVDIGNAGTASSYFIDADFQMVISGTGMSAGNMDVNFLANSTGTNVLEFDNFLVVNVGTVSNWDLSTANSDRMKITNGQFVDCGTISFPASAANRECTDTIFVNCGQVDPSSISFTGNTFQGSSDASGAMLLTDDTNMSNLTFVSDGTGHGILITDNTNSPFTLTDFDVSGFGADGTTDAFIYNNSGGAVTINVTGGSGSITVRDGTGASTTVVNTVTVSTNVKDTSDLSNIQNARVFIEADTGGGLPSDDSVTITRSGTTATVTHTAHGLETGDEVVIRKADQEDYNGIHTITVTGANSYTYTVANSPTTPATGAITSTALLFNDLTDVNGDISFSFAFNGSQPIRGKVRKASSSPRYKTSPITGTITSSGFSATVFLVSDEG